MVVMGGGTGTYTILRGLKNYPLELKAIVAMTDDGGSSGILRDEMGVLPPGDIRQCMIALSESSDVLRKLFLYRFSKGSFRGHSLGNLLISSLEEIDGGLDKALEELHSVLALKGEVIPVTLDKSRLIVELADGEIIFGENNINGSQKIGGNPVKRIFLQPKAKANPRALRALKSADFIIIGPGNFYASLIPIFLVAKIREAIKKSAAKIIYNVNLMTKFGHTDNFSVFDFAEKLAKFLTPKKIDFILFHNQTPSARLLKKYARDGAPVAYPNESDFVKDGIRFIGGDFMSKEFFSQNPADFLKRTLIRHDSVKIAKIIVGLIQEKERVKLNTQAAKSLTPADKFASR